MRLLCIGMNLQKNMHERCVLLSGQLSLVLPFQQYRKKQTMWMTDVQRNLVCGAMCQLALPRTAARSVGLIMTICEMATNKEVQMLSKLIKVRHEDKRTTFKMYVRS